MPEDDRETPEDHEVPALGSQFDIAVDRLRRERRDVACGVVVGGVVPFNSGF